MEFVVRIWRELVVLIFTVLLFTVFTMNHMLLAHTLLHPDIPTTILFHLILPCVLGPKRGQSHPLLHQHPHLLPSPLVIVLRHDLLYLAVQIVDSLRFVLALVRAVIVGD